MFLTRNNIVKLGDFGVSCVLSAPAELAKTFVGTPYYLSPEMLDNSSYGPPSDVWALGCILYEILALQQGVKEAAHFYRYYAEVTDGYKRDPLLEGRFPDGGATVSEG